jgi:hypothetical protein
MFLDDIREECGAVHESASTKLKLSSAPPPPHHVAFVTAEERFFQLMKQTWLLQTTVDCVC